MRRGAGADKRLAARRRRAHAAGMRLAMVRAGVALALLAAAGPAAAADSVFATPPPARIAQLDSARARHGSWHLATTQGALVLQVQRVDSLGVWAHRRDLGLRIERSMVGWDEIAAIRHASGGGVLGTILGSAVGLGFGAAIPAGEPGSRIPLMLGGAVAGGIAGALAARAPGRALALFTGVPLDAPAAEPDRVPAHVRAALTPGTRLRLLGREGMVSGELLAVRPDAVVLRPERVLAWSGVQVLESRRSQAGRGGAIGAAVGAVLCAGVGVAISDIGFGSPSGGNNAGAVAAGAAAGGILGGIAGAVVGSAFHDYALVFVRAVP
jgi:hypothetical protein